MSLLFRVLSAAHANGTHHKLPGDAMNDVQVTWECFAALQARYRSFGL